MKSPSRVRKGLLGVAAGLLLAGAAFAAEADAAESEKKDQTKPQEALPVGQIVDRTNHTSYYQGKDGRARVKMTIVDEQKRKRVREFTILRWDRPGPEAKEDPKQKEQGKDKPAPQEEFCGDQKFYVYFERPADVDKMSFLVWKHLDKEDDRWLYLPALDLIKRISSADKRTSFVGSHFFYEDVSGRNVNDDTHELLEEESNQTYYVLNNTPKDPKTVEFASFKMWIHRKTFLPVQTSYYDKDGKEYRRYNALEVKTIQGFPTVVKSRMTDLRTQGYTDLEYSEVKYDTGVPESVFAERYLRRPPLKYLR